MVRASGSYPLCHPFDPDRRHQDLYENVISVIPYLSFRRKHSDRIIPVAKALFGDRVPEKIL